MSPGEYMRFSFMCKKEKPLKKIEKDVAIIGAGPSGLALAGYLACKGYSITVYERLPYIGGLMVFGIPEFRIPSERVFLGAKELKEIFDVKFKTSCKIVNDSRAILGDNFVKEYIELSKVVEENDATIISTGTWISKDLPAKGSNLKGICSALEYLFKTKAYGFKLIPEMKKIKLGSNVVVVGAGLVAVDAALEAVKEGCNVILISIEKLHEAPAGIFEINKLKDMGAKHIEGSVIKRVIGEKKAEAIEIVDIDAEIRDGLILKLEQISGTERLIEDIDNVIVAIGQVPTSPIETDDFGIKRLKWGAIEVNDKFMTSKEKVFATGDVVTGISKVGRAFQAGLRSAEWIDAYFQKDSIGGIVWN
jgi:glutamate synthase (NADPH/NADH) small chain